MHPGTFSIRISSLAACLVHHGRWHLWGHEFDRFVDFCALDALDFGTWTRDPGSPCFHHFLVRFVSQFHHYFSRGLSSSKQHHHFSNGGNDFQGLNAFLWCSVLDLADETPKMDQQNVDDQKSLHVCWICVPEIFRFRTCKKNGHSKTNRKNLKITPKWKGKSYSKDFEGSIFCVPAESFRECLLILFPVLLGRSRLKNALKANYEMGVLIAFGAMRWKCRGQLEEKTSYIAGKHSDIYIDILFFLERQLDCCF